jgi:hypothetical protein
MRLVPYLSNFDSLRGNHRYRFPTPQDAHMTGDTKIFLKGDLVQQ